MDLHACMHACIHQTHTRRASPSLQKLLQFYHIAAAATASGSSSLSCSGLHDTQITPKTTLHTDATCKQMRSVRPGLHVPAALQQCCNFLLAGQRLLMLRSPAPCPPHPLHTLSPSAANAAALRLAHALPDLDEALQGCEPHATLVPVTGSQLNLHSRTQHLSDPAPTSEACGQQQCSAYKVQQRKLRRNWNQATCCLCQPCSMVPDR